MSIRIASTVTTNVVAEILTSLSCRHLPV